jgi:hypothetical protein
MRPDMKKILGDKRGSRCTVPWKGKRFSPAEFRKYDWDIDDSPFVGGLVGHSLEKALIGPRSRPGGFRGVNTTPVKRFLARQVGRPWNDVLSEMSAALRGSNIAEANWISIVHGHVVLETRVIDGELMAQFWSGELLPLSTVATSFYVDATSGRLHRNTAIETHRMRQKRLAAAEAAERAPRMRELSPYRQLHLLADGNWWEITLADTALTYASPTDDVVLRAGLSNLPSSTLYGRPRVFARTKRILSKAELKRHGLRAPSPR